MLLLKSVIKPRIFFTAFFLLLTTYVSAQTDISQLSLDLGYVNNYQSSFGNNKTLAFAPEVKLGGNFIKKFFEWDFAVSYWDDGIDEILNIQDAPTYSFSSAIISLRLNYYPVEVYIPIHFIAGLSTRFVNEKYIGGEDMGGYHRDDNSFILYTIDLGAGLEYKINETFRIRCDVVAFIPFKEKSRLYNEGYGGSLKIGLDYFINK